jgi:ABC-type phosphate/phosphonate transport system substrate-binding protein
MGLQRIWLLAAMILLWAPGSAPLAHGPDEIPQDTVLKQEAATSEGASGDANLSTRAHDAVTRLQDAPSSPPASAPPKRIKIGVTAIRGAKQALRDWKPTADYLTEHIPGYEFVIVPLIYSPQGDETPGAVARGEADFLLTNPGKYVELEALYGITRISTLMVLTLGKPLTQFGAVIFCRSDRNDVQTLDDLRGKSFMAVDERAFGGWQMTWREFVDAEIDPYREFSTLSFGGTQDKVVYAIRDHRADCGTVRTSQLESMAKEGKIRFENFKVIHRTWAK